MKWSGILFGTFLFFSASGQTTFPASIYDYKVPAYNGGTIDMAQYKGKKIMVINTPSEGFDNPQYAAIEAFYKKHQDNLVVIAVLDEDFGPSPDRRKTPIANKNYKLSCPLAAKVYVKSNKMAPLYHWLTEMKYNHLQDSEVQWDFQKFLINEQGQLVNVFEPKVLLTSPQVTAAISK